MPTQQNSGKKCQNDTDAIPSAQLTYGLTVAPEKSPKFYTHLCNATESADFGRCSCVSAV